MCLNVLPSGEKKLGRVITPDTWKDGARNTTGYVLYLLLAHICSHCASIIQKAIISVLCLAESGGRKLNENKMLTSKKARYGYSEINIILRMFFHCK